MPFLPVMDLWIANNEPPVEQTFPLPASKAPLEKPLLLPDANAPTDQSSPIDLTIEIQPFVIEGSIESFDPVLRAAALLKTIPRNWCGSYTSFDGGPNLDVTLSFSKLVQNGQIISMYGEMMLGEKKTNVYGTLNAKSDHFELLPLSNKLISGLEPGGSFIGLQGLSLSGWTSSRLDNSGGKLKLYQECVEKISKAPGVISIWD